MDNSVIASDQNKRMQSPSLEIWKEQSAKGIYTPHKVSRITCFINQETAESVVDYLKKIDVDAYIEKGRTVREYIKEMPLGLPGLKVKLHSNLMNVFRFTVPVEHSKNVMETITAIAELHIPGKGSIFSQDIVEFSNKEVLLNTDELERNAQSNNQAHFLTDLSHVVCVLSSAGSGELLSRIALELGICVPLITSGTSNDFRDQLGLIRITISPEKEIVHLVMPEHDSQNIIQLLAEEAKLDSPGKGYIYQTPVQSGLIDTRMKTGRQSHAASIDQIIAAIDSLKMGTNWRKRFDAVEQERSTKEILSKDNCELSIITDEDKIDELRELCIQAGANGTITTKLSLALAREEDELHALAKSEISLPAEVASRVVDALLEKRLINTSITDKIQVLDAPAAYHSA